MTEQTVHVFPSYPRLLTIAKGAMSVVRAMVRNPPFRGSIDETTLAGACGIATWELLQHLRAAGYRADAVLAENALYGNHAYVLVGDQRIHCWWIDLTIAQFGGPFIGISNQLSGLAGYTKAGPSHWAYRRGSLTILSDLDDIAEAMDWGVDRTHLGALDRLARSAG